MVATKVEDAPRERGLWLYWVLATTAGFIVGGLAAGAAARAMIDARGGDVIGLTPWEGAAVGAVAGLAIGIGQWLELRPRMAHASWWVLATIVGWIVFDAVLAASGRINPTLGIGGAALAAIVIAMMQWLVLRRGATQAGRWIVVSTAALALAGFAGFAVILAAQFGSWFQLQPTDFPSALPWGVAGMVMGPLYGAMTGAVLAWLLRPTPPDALDAADAQGVRPLERAMTGADPWNERLIAGGLLLLGFLLGIPAVIINAPNVGATSAVGRMLPFLFDPVWEKYWSVAFVVVSLYGLVILEGIVRRAGDHICARLGMVSFTLATVMWLGAILFGGGDFESYFIMLAFPAVIAYGLAILRTRILARWIGIAVVLWSAVELILALGLLVLVFSLFPDGRFVPRFTRWTIVLFLIAQVPSTFFPDAPVTRNTQVSLLVYLTLLGEMAILALVQFYRYRRVSSLMQRQQTKWVVFGLVVPATVYVGGSVLSLVFVALSVYHPLYQPAFIAVVTCTQLLIPLSFGFAMLRYRLWDIDTLINRTLVYGILTASVFGLYVLVVISLGTLLRAQGNLGIPLLATVLIAMLFQPLRHRLQRAINRLMYGERDTPYQVISRLGHRLESTLAPDAILPTIVETVAQALKLPYAAITLKRGDEFTVAASYGTAKHEPVRLPASGSRRI